MRSLPMKLVIPIAALSVCLNIVFIFHHYNHAQKEKEELGSAVYHVMVNINNAVNHLENLDRNHPDYKERLILAQRNFAENRGLIDAHISEMPQNLASWNGGMEVGLGNGIYNINDEGVKETIQDIKNFAKGYHAEYDHVNAQDEPYEALKTIQDVLSSKKYMGDNYINK